MKNYNDNNIKNILKLINGSGLASKSRMIKLADRKFKINKDEVVKSIELLLDLEVIQEKTEMIGDSWNTNENCIVYELVQ
jgi:hypothetical protein